VRGNLAEVPTRTGTLENGNLQVPRTLVEMLELLSQRKREKSMLEGPSYSKHRDS
jgi:hypothetical protein